MQTGSASLQSSDGNNKKITLALKGHSSEEKKGTTEPYYAKKAGQRKSKAFLLHFQAPVIENLPDVFERAIHFKSVRFTDPPILPFGR